MNKTDPYSSQEETEALLQKDTRTFAQKKLDAMLEKRGAWEMESEPFKVLYQIALELIEK